MVMAADRFLRSSRMNEELHCRVGSFWRNQRRFCVGVVERSRSREIYLAGF